MRVQQTTNGIARTDGEVTILFRFGVAPVMVFGDSLVSIERPERFGHWETLTEQHEYLDNFVRNIQPHLMADHRRCIECGHWFDDNPGKPICRTCADWVVTD